MLFLDGVHVVERERLRFRRVKAPEPAERNAWGWATPGQPATVGPAARAPSCNRG
jgi:hypothetical protein